MKEATDNKFFNVGNFIINAFKSLIMVILDFIWEMIKIIFTIIWSIVWSIPKELIEQLISINWKKFIKFVALAIAIEMFEFLIIFCKILWREYFK